MSCLTAKIARKIVPKDIRFKKMVTETENTWKSHDYSDFDILSNSNNCMYL